MEVDATHHHDREGNACAPVVCDERPHPYDERSRTRVAGSGHAQSMSRVGAEAPAQAEVGAIV